MDIEELIKIFNYLQNKYPNESLYLTCRDCFDWFIGSNTSYNVRFNWDSDYIKTFNDFIKNIKDINLNEEE